MRPFLMLIIISMLFACVSSGTKVDQDKLAQFTKGKTTYAEVIQKLGKPNQSTINSDGTRTISYTYLQSQAKASNFIPFVGAFMGGSDTENTNVIINFDENSILTNYTASQGGSQLNTGIVSGQRQQ